MSGEPASIYATDPLAARREVLKARFSIQVEEHNTTAVRAADLVVLAVKPQALPALLTEVGPALSREISRVYRGRGDHCLDS